MKMSETTSSERYTGRVKWFNSKTGYGFVTVTDGEQSGSDVFVHHSSITVEKEQYRYLVQGEYINFNLSRMTEGPHEYQATSVTGVNGGQLMCESLLESGQQIRSYTPRPPRSELPPSAVERRVLPSQTVEKRKQQNSWTSEQRPARGTGRGARGRGRGPGEGGRGAGRGQQRA